MHEVTEAIMALITENSHPPEVEAVREVDRRLRLCKNPDKVLGSKAYLARKAEEDKKNAERRNHKLRLGDVERDPFGNDLSRSETLGDEDDEDDD